MTIWHRPNASDGRVTSPFGRRVAPFPGASTYHEGVDLRAGVHGVDGSIYAAAAGRVSRRYITPMGATVVVLDHGENVTTRYVHMPHDGIFVDVGDRVAGGQRIAIAGKTGAATVHLHFEVRLGGIAVDPVPYLEARGIDLTSTAPAAPSGGGSAIAPPTSEEDDDMPLTDADVQKITTAVWGHKPTGHTPTGGMLVALTQRIRDGHAGTKPLAEFAELLAAIKEVPGAVLGFKPTGQTPVSGMLVALTQRVRDGHRGTKPLPEVADLRAEMLEGFAALSKEIKESRR